MFLESNNTEDIDDLHKVSFDKVMETILEWF